MKKKIRGEKSNTQNKKKDKKKRKKNAMRLDIEQVAVSRRFVCLFGYKNRT
jgi:hypothetical protein